MPPSRCSASTCPVFDVPYNYDRGIEAIENQVVAFARSAGIEVRVTSRLRSCCEQLALYEQGQTTARPTTSQHEFGYAFDLVPVGGYQRYDATFTDAVTWLIALAKFYGAGGGLVEASHAHIEWYSADAWRRSIQARDVVFSIPIPGKRPKSGT
jgi:D-alanyl-D-alanine carboxypeptidase